MTTPPTNRPMTGEDDDLKLVIAHTIIEGLRVQHPGIEQIDNERGDVWLPGGSTPLSAGCIVDVHSLAQSVEQEVRAALTPGHTDLMVSPEAIDAFLDANPAPEPERDGAETRDGNAETFLLAAAESLERGEMPAPGTPYALQWARLTRHVLSLLSTAERQRDEAVRALAPFAAVLVDVGEDEDDEDLYRAMSPEHRRAEPIKVGHLRAARQALQSIGGDR